MNSGNNSSHAALEALHGATWRVLHDLVIGSRGANVDHLVIGPSGVFTINTKNVSGPVWVAERALLVAGTKHSEFLPKAVNEAANVSTMLSRAVGTHVDVTPAIVFVDSELTVKAMPTDVTVLGIEQLARWLKSRPTVFTSEQVNALGSAAAQPQRGWPAPAATASRRGTHSSGGFVRELAVAERCRRRRHTAMRRHPAQQDRGGAMTRRRSRTWRCSVRGA